MVGMHGNYGPNILTNKCDLLIAVGMRFDDRVTGDPKTYASQAKIIHLDIDPAEINKNIIADVPVIGDCKDSLKQITNKIEEMIRSEGIGAEIEVVYQTVDTLHQAIPNHKGDWYFTGNYPTKGGVRVVNKAFTNFMEGNEERAY